MSDLQNMDVIQKATTTVASLAPGGQLVAQQVQRFIELAILQGVLLDKVSMPKMENSTLELPKTRFANRVLRGATSGKALTEADTAEPFFGKTVLNAQLFRARVRVNDEVFEENIERQRLMDTIMNMLGEALGRDMEDLMINGDTTSTDPLLKQLNGVVVQSVSNIVSVGGLRLDKSTLRDLYLALPREFRRNKRSLKYITSDAAEAWYRDSIANRQTPGGDSAVTDDIYPKYNGMEVMGVPLFSENLGTNSNQSVAMFLDLTNIAVGIQRQVTIKTFPDNDAGQQIVAVTLKMDVELIHEPAVSKATGINVGG
jgi:HK97 family phage major capsid protein